MKALTTPSFPSNPIPQFHPLHCNRTPGAAFLNICPHKLWVPQPCHPDLFPHTSHFMPVYKSTKCLLLRHIPSLSENERLLANLLFSVCCLNPIPTVSSLVLQKNTCGSFSCPYAHLLWFPQTFSF